MMCRLWWCSGGLAAALALGCEAAEPQGPQIGLALDNEALRDDIRAIRIQGFRDRSGLSCGGERGSYQLVGTPSDEGDVDLSIDPSRWEVEFQAAAGRWVFHVTAGNDDFPIEGPKRLAEGCIAQSIEAGGAPTIRIQIHDLRLAEWCGDGLPDVGEECDDGNQAAGDGCDPTCRYEPGVCGNSRVDGDETCDDGNSVAGDGCDPTCQSEPFLLPQRYLVGTQSEPRSAAGLDSSDNGGFAVVWTDGSGGTDSSGTGTVIAFFDETGESTANPTGGFFEYSLNTDVQPGNQNWPSVAWAQGGYMATYVDAKASDNDVYGMSYDALRRPRTGWTDDRHLPASWSGVMDRQAVLTANPAHAGFALVWVAGAVGSRKVNMRVFDGTGEAVGSDVVVQAGSAEEEFLPAAAMRADGSFAVAWVQGSIDTTIRLARFSDAGTIVGTVELVGGSMDGAAQSEPAVAYDEAGRLLVTWTDPLTGSVRARLYPATGSPSAEFAVSSGGLVPGAVESSRLTTSVAASGGIFFVVWASQVASVVAGRLVSDANTFERNRVTGDSAEFRIAGLSQAGRARVAITPGGVAMVVWQDRDATGGGDVEGNVRGRVLPVP
jgi:cysteine-rich repeat protein